MWNLLIVSIAILNGGWMLFDGIHVVRNGRYFGPGIPGPWRKLPQKLGVDPMRLGPVFIGLGLFWLASAALAIAAPNLAFWPAMGVAVLTLWYIRLGAALSLIVIVLLLNVGFG